jgi:hypothetical protein
MFTQQDIYNQIATSKRELREGQSSIHALINQLDKEGFWSRMQFDADGRITAILFAHPDSIAYLQSYPDILLFDCTYKTNKYKMPLFDIIGIDACQRSFCVAFAFISDETEESYLWVLQRLKALYELGNTRLPSVILTDCCIQLMNAVSHCFPAAASLLCLWHANKAVIRNCQKFFLQQENGVEQWKEFYSTWHLIIRSKDKETFEERMDNLKKKYIPHFIEQVVYLESSWLGLYKEKLVKAWVDQFLHFETVVSSRVEGIHHLIKEYLDTSTQDCFETWRRIKHAIISQLQQLNYNQAKQQTRTPLELSHKLYDNVHSWVSHEALRKVEEQRKRIDLQDPPLTDCTKSFSTVYGLPCAHIIRDLLSQDLILTMDHFHSHWHLRQNNTSIPQHFLEPRNRFDPLYAQTSLPESSTQREPCAYELVEAATKKKAPSRCSRCHQQGHIMTSKLCPERFVDRLQSSQCIGSSAAQPITQSIVQPVVQSTAQAINQTTLQSLSQLVSQLVSQSTLNTNEQSTLQAEVESPSHFPSPPPAQPVPQAISQPVFSACISAYISACISACIFTYITIRSSTGYLPEVYYCKSYMVCSSAAWHLED